MVNMVQALQAVKGKHPTASDEKNAYRIADRIMEEHGLALPIPLKGKQHEIVKGLHRCLTTYHLKPQDWITYLMAEDPRLLHGTSATLEENCRSFWEVFKLHHSSHAVFE